MSDDRTVRTREDGSECPLAAGLTLPISARMNRLTFLRGLASLLLLLIPVSAVAYEVRVNCGDVAYDSGDTGEHFDADQSYSGNSWGYEGGFVQSNWMSQAVGGTPDPPLYWGARLSVFAFQYRFDVPPGDYDVTLRGVEIGAHWSGVNVMEIRGEGQSLIGGLDVFAEVDRAYALDLRFRVSVSDGVLDLEFLSVQGLAQIAAIEVVTAEVAHGAPSSIADLVVVPGYASLIVDWTDNNDVDLKAYEVSRRTLPSGPWATVQSPQFLASRFIDEDVVEGTGYEYRVTAYDLDGLSSLQSSAVPGQPRLREDSPLRDYELLMTDANIQILNDDIWSTDYVPADFRWALQTWPDVGVRYRGQSHRDGPKKNWKIRFDLVAIEGMDRLNLNSGYTDPSLIREALGFRLAEMAGSYTCRTERVNLFLNGRHRGIHTQIEQIDEGWLDYRDIDSGSIIFKCGDGLHLRPPGAYGLFYERKTEPENYLQPIIDLIETIHLTDDEEFPDSISQVVDVYEFLSWYATMVVTGNRDFATHNFYAVQDGDSGKWSFVAWDLDVSLGASGTFLFDFDATTPIDIGTEENPDVRGFNGLIDRLLEFPKFQWMYAQRLMNLLEGPLALTSLMGEFDAAADEIAGDVPADFRKWGWESSDRQEEELIQIGDYIQARHAFVAAEAVAYQPDIDFAIRINEFLASNSSTNADEFGEFDDWIELVNISDDPMSLSGLWLSDDLTNSRKWALPDVVLGPGAFLILWADDDPEQGPLHAPFKLSAGGETVALWDRSSEGNVLIDYLAFGPQTTDVSMGRLPDGLGPWGFLNPPTPGATNETSSSVEDSVPTPVDAEGSSPPPWLRVFPNPAGDLVTLELTANASPVVLGLFDAAGRQLATVPVPLSEMSGHQFVTVSLGDVLPRDYRGVVWIRPIGPASSGSSAKKLVRIP